MWLFLLGITRIALVWACSSSQCRLGTSTGPCVESVQGIPCAECSQGRGWLDQGGSCHCYSVHDDPTLNCSLTPLLRQQPQWVTLQTTAVWAQLGCNCFASKALGFFSSSSVPAQYGNAGAAWCDQCANALFGPPTRTVAGANVIECNSYGGPDPSLGTGDWAVCAGHGTWDAANYRCVCNSGWALRNATEYAGMGADGETPGLCDVCAPFYGPPKACTAPFTPDPLTGQQAECGGHGSFDGTACRCFDNSTAGHWATAPVTSTFPAYGQVTVLSCVSCVDPNKNPTQGC